MTYIADLSLYCGILTHDDDDDYHENDDDDHDDNDGNYDDDDLRQPTL